LRRFRTSLKGKVEHVDNEIVKRLVWSGMLAASSALASVLAARLSATLWRRLFDEDPPE
jgi:hypothetical protein